MIASLILNVSDTGLTSLVGRAVRVGQITKRPNDSREMIDNDLSAWKTELPEQFQYHDEERSPQAKVFAAMLVLGQQYVDILWYIEAFH